MIIPRLVGMIHLHPLPGSPRFAGSMRDVITAAMNDARTLVGAGFPALMVENFGDSPFFPGRVPSETVAAVTAAVLTLGSEFDTAFGVNVLRNDAVSALSIAAVTGAAFVRVTFSPE